MRWRCIWRLQSSKADRLQSTLCSLGTSPQKEIAAQHFRAASASDGLGLRGRQSALQTAGGNFIESADWIAKVARHSSLAANGAGTRSQADASNRKRSVDGKVVSTDPPYYDNIGYADLSDFFYVWLRRSLKPVFPDLFATLAVPKAEELVATPYRHGSKEKAESFFLDGMTQAMHRLAEQAHPAFPVTIYYAFKQSESESADGTASTGWETFLDAVIRAGFAITGTWPMRTESWQPR